MPDALLSRLSRWIQLCPTEIAAVQNLQGRIWSAERGDTLPSDIRAGSLVLMLDCWVARAKDSPFGRRIITEFLLPGDFLEVGPFTSRACPVIALSRGKVLIVGPAELAALVANPRIREALDWLSAIRRSINAEWLVNIGSRKAHERLAHLLCELSARSNAAGLLNGGTTEMPLTQVDLAAALAMSNVHLNIALQRLRSAGLVILNGRHLAIHDREQLDAMAGFDDGYLLQWPTRLPDRRDWMSDRGRVEERRRSQPGLA